MSVVDYGRCTQPTMKFLYYPHVDPVEVAMVFNPSRMPNWGRFVTFSMWLQGYVPQLVDRVRLYNTVLHRLVHQGRWEGCVDLPERRG